MLRFVIVFLMLAGLGGIFYGVSLTDRDTARPWVVGGVLGVLLSLELVAAAIRDDDDDDEAY